MAERKSCRRGSPCQRAGRPGSPSRVRAQKPPRWARRRPSSRRGRRMAGGRPRRPRGPLPRGTDDLTGPRGRGPARPGEGVETPGHAHGQRQGGAAALRRRPTPPCPRTPGLAPPEQDRSVPATALPGPHRARTGTIPPGPPAQASPRHRCFRRRGTQRLGLARAARARRPCAARATRPVAGPVCGRHRAGKRSGRPRRGTGAGQGEGPQGGRLRPRGPSSLRRGPRRAAALPRGTAEPLGPLGGPPAQRVRPPRWASAGASGPGHAPRGSTGLFDRAGVLLPCAPAVALLLCQRCAWALGGDRRGGPLPALPPAPPSMDALGRQRPRTREQRRGPRCALDGPPPGLRVGRAVMPPRGLVHPPHDGLGADALQRGLGRARPHLVAPHSSVLQQARGGPRRGPALPGGRQTAARACAPPADAPSQALRVPGLVPLALPQLCLSPVTPQHAPLSDHGRAW